MDGTLHIYNFALRKVSNTVNNLLRFLYHQRNESFHELMVKCWGKGTPLMPSEYKSFSKAYCTYFQSSPLEYMRDPDINEVNMEGEIILGAISFGNLSSVFNTSRAVSGWVITTTSLSGVKNSPLVLLMRIWSCYSHQYYLLAAFKRELGKLLQ